MSLLFLLPVLIPVTVLVLIFLWALRPARKTQLTRRDAARLESPRQHATHCPQICQALSSADFEYLTALGAARLTKQVRRERRRVVRHYVSALRCDFDQLLGLARTIAVLSPEVVAVHELERLRLTVQFHWRCRVISLRLLLGAAAVPQVSGVSDLVSHLAVRLEAALQELGERAALATDLASFSDRRNLNAI